MSHSLKHFCQSCSTPSHSLWLLLAWHAQTNTHQLGRGCILFHPIISTQVTWLYLALEPKIAFKFDCLNSLGKSRWSHLSFSVSRAHYLLTSSRWTRPQRVDLKTQVSLKRRKNYLLKHKCTQASWVGLHILLVHTSIHIQLRRKCR